MTSDRSVVVCCSAKIACAFCFGFCGSLRPRLAPSVGDCIQRKSEEFTRNNPPPVILYAAIRTWVGKDTDGRCMTDEIPERRAGLKTALVFAMLFAVLGAVVA